MADPEAAALRTCRADREGGLGERQNKTTIEDGLMPTGTLAGGHASQMTTTHIIESLRSTWTI